MDSLLHRGTAPGTRWLSPALILVLLVWLAACAMQLLRELNDPHKLSVAILALLVALPIVLLKIARIPVYLLAAYATLVPSTDILATGAGLTYTKLLGICVGLTLGISMLGSGKIVKPSKSVILLFVFLAYVGATVFWAGDPSIALHEYGVYLDPMLLFALISLYPISSGDMKIILAGMLGGAILAAGYGDYLFMHGQQIAGDRLYIGFNADQSIDPNEYAAILLVPIALGLMMFLRSRLIVAKSLWFAALLTLSLGFAFSGSRGASVALIIMVVFLFCYSRYKRQLLGIGMASIVGLMTSPIGMRFFAADVSNGAGRYDIWKIGIASLHQYWLFGAGVGNFNQAFTQYFLTVPHQAVSWGVVAHSVFIGMAVELGLVGTLLMLGVWYLHFQELARVRGDGIVADVCLALRAGLLGLLVAGFSLSLLTTKYTWLAFSLVALMRSMLLTSGISIDVAPHTSREATRLAPNQPRYKLT